MEYECGYIPIILQRTTILVRKNEQNNLGIALISVWNQRERRASERRREKGGQSPQKRNETNGFEMLFDAMSFF